MPTYDYACERCGHTFEQFQSITAEPLKKCPRCGKRSLNRLIGAGAGVIFKGSGFYVTDYRSESYKKAAEADRPAASTSSEGKAATGGDDAKSGAAGSSKPASESTAPAGGNGADKPPKKSGTKRSKSAA